MADGFYGDLETALSSFTIQSNDDYYNEEEEETEGEEYEEEEVEIEEKSEELACPFCLEDFDVLGLCCHIDADHRMEVKPGICPVCATKVGINMASHVITQHESILKALCNKKPRGVHSRSSVCILRKEMQEKHLRCIKESPSTGPSSDATADSMFLSFVNNNNSQSVERAQSFDASSKTNTSLSAKNFADDYLERYLNPLMSLLLLVLLLVIFIIFHKPPSMSTDKNHERASRCEFVQSLLLSSILNDL